MCHSLQFGWKGLNFKVSGHWQKCYLFERFLLRYFMHSYKIWTAILVVYPEIEFAIRRSKKWVRLGPENESYRKLESRRETEVDGNPNFDSWIKTSWELEPKLERIWNIILNKPLGWNSDGMIVHSTLESDAVQIMSLISIPYMEAAS